MDSAEMGYDEKKLHLCKCSDNTTCKDSKKKSTEHERKSRVFFEASKIESSKEEHPYAYIQHKRKEYKRKAALLVLEDFDIALAKKENFSEEEYLCTHTIDTCIYSDKGLQSNTLPLFEERKCYTPRNAGDNQHGKKMRKKKSNIAIDSGVLSATERYIDAGYCINSSFGIVSRKTELPETERHPCEYTATNAVCEHPDGISKHSPYMASDEYVCNSGEVFAASRRERRARLVIGDFVLNSTEMEDPERREEHLCEHTLANCVHTNRKSLSLTVIAREQTDLVKIRGEKASVVVGKENTDLAKKQHTEISNLCTDVAKGNCKDPNKISNSVVWIDSGEHMCNPGENAGKDLSRYLCEDPYSPVSIERMRHCESKLTLIKNAIAVVDPNTKSIYKSSRAQPDWHGRALLLPVPEVTRYYFQRYCDQRFFPEISQKMFPPDENGKWCNHNGIIMCKDPPPIELQWTGITFGKGFDYVALLERCERDIPIMLKSEKLLYQGDAVYIANPFINPNDDANAILRDICNLIFSFQEYMKALKQRVDFYQFPDWSISELLHNAIAHGTRYCTKGNVEVTCFSNKNGSCFISIDYKLDKSTQDQLHGFLQVLRGKKKHHKKYFPSSTLETTKVTYGLPETRVVKLKGDKRYYRGGGSGLRDSDNIEVGYEIHNGKITFLIRVRPGYIGL
jgi:hypothetical protein